MDELLAALLGLSILLFLPLATFVILLRFRREQRSRLAELGHELRALRASLESRPSAAADERPAEQGVMPETPSTAPEEAVAPGVGTADAAGVAPTAGLFTAGAEPDVASPFPPAAIPRWTEPF